MIVLYIFLMNIMDVLLLIMIFYFFHLMIMYFVGYKMPTVEVLSGIDYTTTSPGLLREPGSVTENSNSFSRKQTPPGLLREPGSVADIDYRTASPGLLRESGSVLSVNCW